MPKAHSKHTKTHETRVKKQEKNLTGIVFPNFLFKERDLTPHGQFRSVYGRLIPHNETPASPSDFIDQKIKSVKAILDAGAGMLDDAVLNWATRFNMHTFTTRVATIETHMIILIKGGIVLEKQKSVSLLSDALRRMVRLAFFSKTDMEVLGKMTLELAERLAKIEFRDDRGGFWQRSIRDSVRSTRENLRSKITKAKSHTLTTGKRFTFQWSGDKGTDKALAIVGQSEELWRGHGMIHKTFGKTDEIQDSLDEARAVMWQLHFKMAQKDPASAAVLFDEVDAIVNQLALCELSSGQKHQVAAWGSKLSDGKTWKKRIEDMLINKTWRAFKYVAKQVKKAALLSSPGDIEFAFYLDLALCGFDILDQLGFLDFNGFAESVFDASVPVDGIGEGYSLITGEMKPTDGAGSVDSALDSVLEHDDNVGTLEGVDEAVEAVVDAVETAKDVKDAVEEVVHAVKDEKAAAKAVKDAAKTPKGGKEKEEEKDEIDQILEDISDVDNGGIVNSELDSLVEELEDTVGAAEAEGNSEPEVGVEDLEAVEAAVDDVEAEEAAAMLETKDDKEEEINDEEAAKTLETQDDKEKAINDEEAAETLETKADKEEAIKDVVKAKGHKAKHKSHKAKQKVGATSAASAPQRASQPPRPSPKSQACTIS